MSIETMVLAFAAISIGGFLKGVTGVGLPVLAIPVLGYFLGLPHAISLLIVPVFLTNLLQSVQTLHTWREVSFFGSAIMVGMLGLVAGSWILTIVDPHRLNLGLALMLFVFIGTRIFMPNFVIPPTIFRRYAPVTGFLGGLAQGTTGLCGAVVAPYIQCGPISREAKIFSISTVFLTFSVIQLITLFSLDLYKPSYFLEGVLAFIPAAIFMTVGTWLRTRFSVRFYDRALLFVLTLVAIGLIEKGL